MSHGELAGVEAREEGKGEGPSWTQPQGQE